MKIIFNRALGIKNVRLLGIVAVVLVVAVIAIFSFQNNFSYHNEKQLQNVTVKLKWFNHAQFAGNYIAAEKDFYANEGLNVKLVPFIYGSSTPPIDDVVSGRADFGITGADELLVARSNGAQIKAFAVIYRISPVVAYSLKESGIIGPQNFVGKTVGIERGTNVEILYDAMMSKLKINRSVIKEVTIGFDAAELLNGTTDVSTGYIINEPRLAQLAGHEVNIILMADYGVNIYGDVLFTTDEMVNKRPELVYNFTKATLDGWQYAIANPDDAVNAILKYAPDRNRTFELGTLQISTPLINTVEFPIGMMTSNDWQKAYDILKNQHLLQNEFNVSDAYTMQFLYEMYGNGG